MISPMVVAALAVIAALVLGAVANRWHQWKAGQRGAARILVETIMVAAAAGLAWWALALIGADNALVGAAVWVCSWWTLGIAWAELDERLEQWEQS